MANPYGKKHGPSFDLGLLTLDSYNRAMSTTITLLTDFGERDGYVAAMKGVMLSEAPGAVLVDAGHEIPPQDVRTAAWALYQYWKYYPEGTIHVAVVDPGVGTERAILVVKADGRHLIAPNNGLLTWVLADAERVEVAVLSESVHRPADVSSTFHGRDIMAYAAALLAGGRPVDTKAFPPKDVEQPDWAHVKQHRERLEGNVVHIDHFGNIVTSITKLHLNEAGWPAFFVETRTRTVAGPSRTYGDGEEGEALALIGSSGHLELAVAQGSAAEALGLVVGSAVVVVPAG